MKNIKVDFKILFIIILSIYLSNIGCENKKNKNINLENKWMDIRLNFK